MLRAIEDSPGLGFRELARRTGVPAGTLAHHVGLLTRAGAVWTRRHGARVLHFPAPRLDEPAPVRYALEEHVLDALDRDLLAWLREAPRVQKAVLERFGAHPRATVQHRLERLTDWGFLSARTQGRCRIYAATQGGDRM
ncbi:MAG: winged helix-turn-helix transcriptional regulator [Thermoplasmatota archaeon]